VVIYRGADKIYEDSGSITASPEVTNNVAEYSALDLILDWFITNGLTGEPIAVFGDSNMVIQQCFGTWKIRGGYYAEIARVVKEKLKQFTNIRGSWIPREENGTADDLSKAHLRAAGVEFRIQPEG
jgi:ribonuclease HI